MRESTVPFDPHFGQSAEMDDGWVVVGSEGAVLQCAGNVALVSARLEVASNSPTTRSGQAVWHHRTNQGRCGCGEHQMSNVVVFVFRFSTSTAQWWNHLEDTVMRPPNTTGFGDSMDIIGDDRIFVGTSKSTVWWMPQTSHGFQCVQFCTVVDLFSSSSHQNISNSTSPGWSISKAGVVLMYRWNDEWQLVFLFDLRQSDTRCAIWIPLDDCGWRSICCCCCWMSKLRQRVRVHARLGCMANRDQDPTIGWNKRRSFLQFPMQ